MKSRWISWWLCVAVPGSTCLAADHLNVLFITVDDMNRDSVGVYGSKVPETTPNIDRLAAEGLRFEHAHVTVAICQPTRAVWMTGRYPHNSGALGFDEIRASVPTLPETLRRNGFYTGILGKTDHVVPSRKNAFEYRRQREEMLYGRSADLYGKFVAEFLRNARRSDRPFFLMVNTDDPHRPFDTRTPAGERKVFEVAPATNDKTAWYGAEFPAPSRIYQPEEVVVPGFLPDLPEIREEIARYYSSVRRADDVVGRVLDELEAAGFADNTLVMLKSDHGISMPFAKTNVWRHSTLTPWIVRWPGVIKPGVHETEHLVAGVDLAPTLLDVVGIDAMQGMDGRSFLPVLEGEKQDGREFVYTQINTLITGASHTMRSIQGKRFGLIWNAWSDGKTAFSNESTKGLTWNAMVSAAESDPAVAARVKHFQYRVPLEFYDYERDPDALDNRIHDPQMREVIQDYALQLGEFMRSTGDFALSDYERLDLRPKRGPGR
ncbi:MAG: sulfatase [Gammaproteobacteria bacterium]|nr:sulfatase [Gammaproteobacteria bacterium]